MKKNIYIILTFLLFHIIKSKIRHLLEEDEMIKICSKCKSGFNSTYNNTELLNNISSDDKITPYVIKLVEMFKSDFNSSELIEEYIYPRVISPNIIFPIIMIILLIIWIILIVKECKKKKVLNFNNNNSKPKFLYPLSFLIFIIIIILSSISIFYIYESSLYFNSSMCALFRIYIDIRDGDQSNGTYWKGIRDLQKDLVGDKVIINKLINSIELQENVTYDLQNNDLNKKYQDKTYYKEEENNNFYYDYSVSSPSSSIIKAYPTYTRNRRADIENINLEYKLKLYPGVEVNEKIKGINEPIKKNPSLITSEFAIVNDYLSDMLDTVQISAEEYLQYLIDYSKKVNYIVSPLLYSIFILSIIFSILGIIFLHLHAKNIKNIYSILLHILWNFKFILVFLATVSIIIFRLFKIFGEDGSGLIQYATSESNLNSTDSIIFKGTGKAFLKMCFNNEDNGDLLSKILKLIDTDSSKIAQLKSIALAEIFVKEYYNQMEGVQLDETKKILDDLKNLYKDYSLISYYELLILKNTQDVLDDLNYYTDYSGIISYQSPTSNKHSYDVWTTISENCENKYNNYEYINNESAREEGKKYCMVLDEFDKEIAKNFYSGISCILPKNIDDHFSEVYDNLNNFNKENKVYLNENPNLIEMTNNYYNELLIIKEKILNGLNHSRNIVDCINKILHASSDASVPVDLFSFMNCQFLQRDLKVFYFEMEKLSNNTTPFLVVGILLLVFKTISIILVTSNINKSKNEAKEERESASSSNLLN